MDCQHAWIRLVRVVRAREVDGIVARAGAALEGVVLDDTVEPVVVQQPAVRLTVAVWGLLMAMRVAAASKATVDVGRMVRRGAETRGQKEKRRVL
jgi:hypothetical protein